MRGTAHSPSWGRIRLSVLLATVAAFLLVPAAQAFANATLTVSAEGTGSGEASSVGGAAAMGEEFEELGNQWEGSPPIECHLPSQGGDVCETEAVVEEGLEGLALHAVAGPGTKFVEWEISGAGVFGPCEVSFEATSCFIVPNSPESNVEVVAYFEKTVAPKLPLTVSKSGTGEGTVTSSPAGIECGTKCEAEFEEGKEVELSQSAETGSEFVEWGGACSGAGSCTVTMSEAEEVTATFDLESETLTAEVEGPGSVTAPEDINCPGVCAGAYNYGETVTLTAEPDSGAELVEWSGACDSVAGNECEVEMTADKTVKAVFALEPMPEFDLTVVKAGSGSGSVTCNAGACAATYPEGEEVTLAATAASGSTFSGWSGAGCSGTGTCEVTIEEDTTVTATFNANAKGETKKEEVKPPPPTEGAAKAAGTASVKSGKASLKLSCSGGPCKGTVQLKAKVKQGKKVKNLVIGKASFSLADGASATIKVKLSGPAKQELAKGKTLKAKTSGPGVTSGTVKLKPAKAKKK
jgi:hypothetical protein